MLIAQYVLSISLLPFTETPSNRYKTAPGVHGGLSLAGKDIIKEMNRVGL
jgi:hypothetical protein